MTITIGKHVSFTISDSDKTAIHMWIAFVMGIIGYGLILCAPIFILWNYVMIDLVSPGVLVHMSLAKALAISVLLTIQIRVSSYVSAPRIEKESSTRSKAQEVSE